MKIKKLLLIAIFTIIVTISYAVLVPRTKVIMKTAIHKIGTAPKSISEDPAIAKFILEYSQTERNYFSKLDSNINEIEQIRKLGFKNAIDPRYSIEDIKYIKFLYKAYDQIYPNNQFITNNCLKFLLDKFGLHHDNVENYIGEIPKKNIQEIADFEICALDRRLMRISDYKWNYFTRYISCTSVEINDPECKRRLNLADYKLWFPLNYNLHPLCSSIQRVNALYYEIHYSDLKYNEKYSFNIDAFCRYTYTLVLDEIIISFGIKHELYNGIYKYINISIKNKNDISLLSFYCNAIKEIEEQKIMIFINVFRDKLKAYTYKLINNYLDN